MHVHLQHSLTPVQLQPLYCIIHTSSLQYVNGLVISKFEPVCEVINHLKEINLPSLNVTEARECNESQNAMDDMDILHSIQAVAESTKQAACIWVCSSG